MWYFCIKKRVIYLHRPCWVEKIIALGCLCVLMGIVSCAREIKPLPGGCIVSYIHTYCLPINCEPASGGCPIVSGSNAMPAPDPYMIGTLSHPSRLKVCVNLDKVQRLSSGRVYLASAQLATFEGFPPARDSNLGINLWINSARKKLGLHLAWREAWETNVKTESILLGSAPMTKHLALTKDFMYSHLTISSRTKLEAGEEWQTIIVSLKK